MSGVCDIEGQRCHHPIACEAGGCVKQRRAPAARMTTQQDSVDVERLREAIKATEYKYFGDYEMSDDQRAAVNVLVECAEQRIAALSLPITQRDEQGTKTYADAIADAAKVAQSTADEWLRFRRQGGVSLGAETYDAHDCDHANRTAAGIATAIRRLSIEQGDQDGGEG